MGDPIQDLQAALADGNDRVHMIHRNEWPRLWRAIDRIAALRFPNDYMVTAEQHEPDEAPEEDAAFAGPGDFDEYLEHHRQRREEWEKGRENAKGSDFVDARVRLEVDPVPDRPSPPFHIMVEGEVIEVFEVDMQGGEGPEVWIGERVFVDADVNETWYRERMKERRELLGHLAEDWSSPEDAEYDDDEVMVEMDTPDLTFRIPPGMYELTEEEMGELPVLSPEDIKEVEITTEVEINRGRSVAEGEFTVQDPGEPIDLDSIAEYAGTDPEEWAAWFQARLEDNPPVGHEELVQWFHQMLRMRERAEYPLIEVILNEHGDVVSMRTVAEIEDPEWDEDEQGLDPEDPTVYDPEDPGF